MGSTTKVQKLPQPKHWKWVGKVTTGNENRKVLYGLVTASTDSDKTIEVNLCDGVSSLVGNLQSAQERYESLASICADSRMAAIRKVFSYNPPLARVENSELIMSVPWGLEYGVSINLDIESVRLRHVQGSSSFLMLLFGEIEKGRQELKCLNEKVQYLHNETNDLQRAKKTLGKYLDARPERLRVAAQVLNEFKKTCRLAKGEDHGPEENVGQN